MPNQSTFSAATDGARVSGTLTDTNIANPVAPIAGLQAVGPRVTFNFITDPWSSDNTYQYYDVVNVSGASYVARQNVPTGIELTNEDYWFRWNDPNAQFAELENTVQLYNTRITNLEDNAIPQNHASADTTYGIGSATQYGHVKLYTSVGSQTDGAATAGAVQSAISAAVSPISGRFPVDTADIADDAVTSAKLADGSVGSAAIAANAVTAAAVASGAVGASELASSAVTTAKIATGAVTTDKLANGVADNILSGVSVRTFGNTFTGGDNTGASYPDACYVAGAYIEALNMLIITTLACDSASDFGTANPITLPSYVPSMTISGASTSLVAFGGVLWSSSDDFASWYGIHINGRQITCNRTQGSGAFAGIPFTVICTPFETANTASASSYNSALSNNAAYNAGV